MEDITLQLGESKTFTRQDYIGSEIISLSHITLPGSYVICGNITTRDSFPNYQLDFNQSITEVTTQLFGTSYNLEVQDSFSEIYLNTLEDVDILNYTFSIIRIQ